MQDANEMECLIFEVAIRNIVSGKVNKRVQSFGISGREGGFPFLGQKLAEVAIWSKILSSILITIVIIERGFRNKNPISVYIYNQTELKHLSF